jgi:Cu-processing system permease protein
MRRIRTIATITWQEMLRRKEIYVLLILLAALLLGLVSLNIFGLGSVVGFVNDIGLLTAWILGWILAITCASRQLPQEERRGTILTLLAKPILRGELIVGKWLGAWSVVSASVLCFYVMTWVITVCYGGTFDLLPLTQAYLLHTLALAVIVAMTIALSTRLNQDAAATISYVASATMFLLVPRIPELMAYAQGWRQTGLLIVYGMLPHFELFDMRQRVIHQFGTMPWSLFFVIIIYGSIVTAALLLIAWLGFRTKHFSRSNQD